MSSIHPPRLRDESRFDRRLGRACTVGLPSAPGTGTSGSCAPTGLIAGGSIAGILFAVLVGTNTIGPLQRLGDILPALHEEGLIGMLATAGLFLALAVIVARAGKRKVE